MRTKGHLPCRGIIAASSVIRRDACRLARRSLRPAMQVIVALLLVAFAVSTRRAQLTARVAARVARWESSAGWSRRIPRLRSSDAHRTDPADRRDTARSAALRLSVPARAGSARVRNARRCDGVAGFVLGLLLVTLVLTAAVAFAAQPVK